MVKLSIWVKHYHGRESEQRGNSNGMFSKKKIKKVFFVVVCVRKHSPTNAAYNPYTCYITSPICLCLPPSLTQTLSSLFLCPTKHQFTVPPIKAHIHAANYQWQDSFGLLSILHQPSSFSILSVEATLAFNVTVLGLTKVSCLWLQVSDGCLTSPAERVTYVHVKHHYPIAHRERSALENTVCVSFAFEM